MRAHASFADGELNLLGIRSYHSEGGGQDEIPRVRRGRARGIFWWHASQGRCRRHFLGAAQTPRAASTRRLCRERSSPPNSPPAPRHSSAPPSGRPPPPPSLLP